MVESLHGCIVGRSLACRRTDPSHCRLDESRHKHDSEPLLHENAGHLPFLMWNFRGFAENTSFRPDTIYWVFREKPIRGWLR